MGGRAVTCGAVLVCMVHRLPFALVQMKLLELQELVMRLVRERNEWYKKYMAAAQGPELSSSPSHGALPTERCVELNATNSQGKAQPGPVLGDL